MRSCSARTTSCCWARTSCCWARTSCSKHRRKRCPKTCCCRSRSGSKSCCCRSRSGSKSCCCRSRSGSKNCCCPCRSYSVPPQHRQVQKAPPLSLLQRLSTSYEFLLGELREELQLGVMQSPCLRKGRARDFLPRAPHAIESLDHQ